MVQVYIWKEKNNYSVEDLVGIMQLLRGENGCPWDKEQTHSSIRNNLLEEAYETADAIDRLDDKDMAEELGDLLLQIVFHCQMASERQAYDLNTVADGICKKLIYRHPHIFYYVVAKTSDEVLDNWDKLKKKEKSQKTDTDTLKSVAASLPALMRAYKVRKKASKAGLDISGSADRLEKLLREYRENGASQELAGDIIFEAVGIANEADVEPEEALTRRVERFIADFEKAEIGGQIKGKKLGEL